MWINVEVPLTRHIEGQVQVLRDLTETASDLKDQYLTYDALSETYPRASGRPAG